MKSTSTTTPLAATADRPVTGGKKLSPFPSPSAASFSPEFIRDFRRFYVLAASLLSNSNSAATAEPTALLAHLATPTTPAAPVQASHPNNPPASTRSTTPSPTPLTRRTRQLAPPRRQPPDLPAPRGPARQTSRLPTAHPA